MAGHFVNEGDPPMISHEWRYFSLPKGANLPTSRPPDLPFALELSWARIRELSNSVAMRLDENLGSRKRYTRLKELFWC